MYNIIRRIHLFCSMIILIFLVMYFVSGYTMTHRPWFVFPKPPLITQTFPLESADTTASDEAIAEAVKKQLSLPGRMKLPATQPAGLTRFFVIYPGMQYRIDVSKTDKTIQVYKQREGWVGTFVIMHKVEGYDGDPIFNAVALFCDLSGLSMIVFAISGVYLWWKSTRHHFWGFVCLGVSGVYAVGMMFYFAFAA